MTRTIKIAGALIVGLVLAPATAAPTTYPPLRSWEPPIILHDDGRPPGTRMCIWSKDGTVICKVDRPKPPPKEPK